VVAFFTISDGKTDMRFVAIACPFSRLGHPPDVCQRRAISLVREQLRVLGHFLKSSKENLRAQSSEWLGK
jgi:hypothetical protein